ncbi:Ig-like domain-containing protein [Mycolicibacterium crocinum]|uniref:Ig-like domain-containing protein n=1 Tax=Mycolicibacterium crocinum TaxID=388459 RepID=A0ABY3TYP9_9MYCO|nr:Ig-like domain-containing protein [Mycolicibacterium crocinum]ULN44072.1 Ig-like domain-containing protein [Mycolicibacterium crocinum]
MAVLARAVNRLADWPGLPRNFTDITTYQTDYTLDAFDNQFDALIASAIPGSPARWVPDLLGLTGMFVTSAIPSYSFTDSLNAMGDFLNRIVPKFKIADGAGTFDIISPYKIMGAAVVGTATVLKDMLNGIYDPTTIVIHVIKATVGADVTASDLTDFNSLQNKVIAAQAGGVLGTGDGGAFDEPERAWNITLPTLTAAQVNPFTVGTYVVLVAMYKRFQEMAALTTYTTWTTYDSWHYTNGLGMYAAGTFHAVDPDGGSIEFRADGTLGKTYTTAGNALVTINTVEGGFTYTPPALWDSQAQGAAFRHRSTAEDPEERFDWVTVQAYNADGAPINLRVGVEIINGTNAAPTFGSTTILSTDALGVVKGKITGADADGDPLKFFLVDSSVNGLNGNSAYTKNGAGNGGIVTLSQNGDFTYVSSATAGVTQSFQVRINDGHYGNTTVTVTVPNTTTITPANPNTSTQYYYSGTVPNSTNKPGTFVNYALGTAPTKGTVTSFNPTTGAFTYHRNESLGHTTTASDVVTVIATDADGRTVTLKMTVQPTVPNAVPVILSSTTDVGNASSARWGLNTTTWTQTTTGKITASDADIVDSLSYSLVNATTHAPVTTTTNGGTVAFNADGSYTYTITRDQAYFHGAARIGASGAAVADTFTVAVSDGYGGVAYTTVSMAIYAVNSSPTLSLGSLVCAFTSCTITITTTDPDNDDLSGSLNTSNNGAGAPWYTLERGSVTINAGNQHTMTWGGNNNGAGTQQTGNQRYTVYDGYYRVSNGVVDSGYFSRAWVNWSNTTRTTGN